MPSSGWKNMAMRQTHRLSLTIHRMTALPRTQIGCAVGGDFTDATVKVWVPTGVVILLFFNDTATTEIYTLSLHDALPIWYGHGRVFAHFVPLRVQSHSRLLI